MRLGRYQRHALMESCFADSGPSELLPHLNEVVRAVLTVLSYEQAGLPFATHLSLLQFIARASPGLVFTLPCHEFIHALNNSTSQRFGRVSESSPLAALLSQSA